MPLADHEVSSSILKSMQNIPFTVKKDPFYTILLMFLLFYCHREGCMKLVNITSRLLLLQWWQHFV